MNAVSTWFDYAATGKILVFGLLVGTGVLFIARDFIEHASGWQCDDWGNWDEVLGVD
ncbi:hypothetical protein [Mycobacterium sp. UM_WGJ]|uniref:hypothetical protein n=1 Tax=Mycobacterium sp. UM_WGJ TaxID=1370120 RepID=UPI0004167D8C|nr:hypothetical protein [Mycobacterium sp. UM_WGJ]